MAALLARLIGFFAPLVNWATVASWFVSAGRTLLFTVGIPLAINWGAFEVAKNNSSTIFSTLGLSPHTIQLTGLAAWLANALRIPFAVSVYMGFVAQAFTLKLVGRYQSSIANLNVNRYR